MNITDAAVDSAEAVHVEFTGITLKHENESPRSIEFDEARSIDLLALEGEAFETLLDDISVTAGQYQWLRLMVNAEKDTTDSYIELDDGSTHSLYVPSGGQTGLKLVSGFAVPQGGSASFTIDFDLRKSVINPQNDGDYFLKPTLRLIDNSTVGHIAGDFDITPSACEEGDSMAAYLYDGHGATPTDIDTSREDALNPVTTARIVLDDDSGEYGYSIGYLDPGEYTLAYTCDADQDHPEEDNSEDMDFHDAVDVEVVESNTTTVDLPL